MDEFGIIVKTIQSGQPRPYADAIYKYEIEAKNCSEWMVKAFCTKVLRPCNQTIDNWDIGSADSYFHGYYTFSKIDDNKYRYCKVEPYTG